MKWLLLALFLASCATATPPLVEPTPPAVRTVGDLLLTLCNEEDDAQSCASLAASYDGEGDRKRAQKFWNRACALGNTASCAHR